MANKKKAPAKKLEIVAFGGRRLSSLKRFLKVSEEVFALEISDPEEARVFLGNTQGDLDIFSGSVHVRGVCQVRSCELKGKGYMIELRGTMVEGKITKDLKSRFGL